MKKVGLQKRRACCIVLRVFVFVGILTKNINSKVSDPGDEASGEAVGRSPSSGSGAASVLLVAREEVQVPREGAGPRAERAHEAGGRGRREAAHAARGAAHPSGQRAGRAEQLQPAHYPTYTDEDSLFPKLCLKLSNIYKPRTRQSTSKLHLGITPICQSFPI